MVVPALVVPTAPRSSDGQDFTQLCLPLKQIED
jgi:hypothetical protein